VKRSNKTRCVVGYSNRNYLFHDRNSSTRNKYRNLIEKGKTEYNCGVSHELGPKYGCWK